jgi:DNA polymerase-3 subunit delta
MINYIENKNLSKSLFVLAKLLEQGEEPVKILISVYSCIKRLLNAKSMIEEGKKSIQDIKSFLKIHPYFQNQFIENLQSHKLKTLKECLNLILEADIILKTGAGDFRMAFEKILISICSK